MIINSQLGGKKPTGTKSITANGTHNVAGYEYADVQVPTTVPAHYIKKTVDANGKLVNGSNIIDLTGATDIGNYVLYYAYSGAVFPANTNLDFSSLTQITGGSACASAFQNTRNIISVDLSGLVSITGVLACQNMFSQSPELQTVNISSLGTINSNFVCNGMFSNTHLTSCNFSSLSIIEGTSAITGIFTNCQHLKDVYFGALKSSTFVNQTNQLQTIFNTNTGLQATGGCTVHFPSNFDPSDPNHTFDASTLAGYPTFGGNASYIHVAFDLAATE